MRKLGVSIADLEPKVNYERVLVYRYKKLSPFTDIYNLPKLEKVIDYQLSIKGGYLNVRDIA